MSFLFLPLYIHFMGVEAYGLVGVFASLLSLFSILDLGLSATMTREMARLSALDPRGIETRGLARTIEVVYWIVAILLGLAVIALARPVAEYWLKPDRIEPQVISQALAISGGIVALRWPTAFYVGGLRGLDRQPLLNLILSVSATIRGVGSVMVLWLISPTIQVFFLYQLLSSAIEISCLVWAFWRSLPGNGTGAVFAFRHLKRVWRFSAGMTGISIVALLLTQTDKIVLSKILPLDLFGYYTLSWTVSAILLQIVGPVDIAIYPTLTRMVGQEDARTLRRMYHKSCQMEVVVLIPATLLLILFGDTLLMAWSGNPELVRNVGPVMSVLAVGMCLNGFMHVPYFTQLAYGWTSLSFWQNVISLLVFVPLLVLLTKNYGGLGAAVVWVILNAGYVIISINIMHRRILCDSKWDWYLCDVGLPTAAAVIVALAGKLIMPNQLSILAQVIYVCGVGLLCFLAAVFSAPFPRAGLFGTVKYLWRGLKPSVD